MGLCMREQTLLENEWRFALDLAPEADFAAHTPEHDDTGWRVLDLPHDWSIEGPFDEMNPSTGQGGYLPGGIGWYRTHFSLSAEQVAKQVTLQFDGVYKHCQVWLNGDMVGEHAYGYTSFHCDLTPSLVEGDNLLAVRVDCSQRPDSRWYSGAGIYRHVWLIVREALHVDDWGVYIRTPQISDDLATLSIETTLVNSGEVERTCRLLSRVLSADGQQVGQVERSYPLAPDQTLTVHQILQVPKPRRWSLEDPYLYTSRSELFEGDRLVDDVETPIGIREIAFDADLGFLLNGEQVKLNGVCLHHDGGCVGAAVPEAVWERRLRLLQEMGCNAIRSSHYPPAPELLDMCDRMGILVQDEAFDEWRAGKVFHGYYEDFDAWALVDLDSMVLRDRNHPSVVMWSIGNEIPEQSRQEGVQLAWMLADRVRELDPSRPVTSACDLMDAPPLANGPTAQGFLDALDVVGYNYVDRWGDLRTLMYSVDRELYPERCMIGSENVCASSVRGEYSLGDDAMAWRGPYWSNILRPERVLTFTQTHDYVAGDFIWTGIDYLGETRWPSKLGSFGVLDLCGFEKDGYYFYQSQWSDKPMVHLLPHWNWEGREGQVLPVLCYTNCDSIELFVNGKSWGTKSYKYAFKGFDRGYPWGDPHHNLPVHPSTSERHLCWDVPYTPGSLLAVARNGGNIVCETEIVTAGAPARLDLSVDRSTLSADGRDVAHLTVRVLDADGNLAPNASDRVTFQVQGAGRLLAVDNGAPADHDPFQASERKAFHGMCLGLVQAGREAGNIMARVAAPGLVGAEVEISVG